MRHICMCEAYGILRTSGTLAAAGGNYFKIQLTNHYFYIMPLTLIQQLQNIISNTAADETEIILTSGLSVPST